MQTEVVHVLVSWAWRIQSSSGSCSSSARVPNPPGTTRMSGLGTSSSDASATSESVSDSLRTGPASSATKIVSVSGTLFSTSCGPVMSRAVKRS